MEYYLEFRARPSEDIAPEIIISQAFSLCHVEMVKLKAQNIGVSFPEADNSIGSVMRVHGNQQSLQVLTEAVANLSDYCHIGACRKIPTDCEWRIIKRIQPKMSAAKIRRLVKRGSISKQEADERLLSPCTVSHPYIQLRSRSTSQNFRLFISQIATAPPVQPSQFNTYGLGGSVPWF